MSAAALPLIIEPQAFHEFMQQAQGCDLLIIDLCSEQSYAAAHIPGAVFVAPKALSCGQPPAPGRLPDQAHLDALFSSLGLTPETHVVVYDDEGGGWAGRMIWTLDVIGHTRYSYINGGLPAWKTAGLPLQTASCQRQPVPQQVIIHRQPIAEIDDILPNLNSANFVVWDARGPLEYSGEKVLAAKGGHIPGAINAEWTSLMDPARDLRIRTDAREYLAALGIDGSKKIVTHCQSHHRSAFTYLVGKMLGFDIKGYHGSWSEWGNHADTPVEK